MQDFHKLKVWEKSHQLTLAVYRATARFPREETYSLTSQIRRCAASIPSNIAEGCGRGSNADLIRFLHIAMGSASELEYQLHLAHELMYVQDADYHALDGEVTEVKRMLSGFIAHLRSGKGA